MLRARARPGKTRSGSVPPGVTEAVGQSRARARARLVSRLASGRIGQWSKWKVVISYSGQIGTVVKSDSGQKGPSCFARLPLRCGAEGEPCHPASPTPSQSARARPRIPRPPPRMSAACPAPSDSDECGRAGSAAAVQARLRPGLQRAGRRPARLRPAAAAAAAAAAVTAAAAATSVCAAPAAPLWVRLRGDAQRLRPRLRRARARFVRLRRSRVRVGAGPQRVPLRPTRTRAARVRPGPGRCGWVVRGCGSGGGWNEWESRRGVGIVGCCKGGSMRAKDVRTRANRAMPRRSHSTDGDSGQTGPRVKQHRGQMEIVV